MKNLINHQTSNSTLLTPDQASLILGISPDTLAVWCCTKRYPLAYVRVGRLIRYRLDDIEAFIKLRTCNYREFRL